MRDYEADQRQFRELIEDVVSGHGIKFVGEEAKQGKRSIAEDIAAFSGIRYANIDIPLDVQEKIQKQPADVFNDEKLEWESLLKSDKYAKAWNLVREFHMYRSFLQTLHTGEQALLICGRLHVQGLTELLSQHMETIPICFGPKFDDCCTA